MRDLPSSARSRCLWAFSIMTMAASTMAPIAIAMPPRLMMLEPMPSSFIAANAISTPTGNIRIATSALRTWSRNTMQTSATTRLSSNSVCLSLGRRGLLRHRLRRGRLGGSGGRLRLSPPRAPPPPAQARAPLQARALPPPAQARAPQSGRAPRPGFRRATPAPPQAAARGSPPPGGVRSSAIRS